MTTNQSAAVSEHNPDSLSSGQIGDGWRLLTRGEASAGQLLPDGVEWWTWHSTWSPCSEKGGHGDPRALPNITYRIRLSPDDRSAKKGTKYYVHRDGDKFYVSDSFDSTGTIMARDLTAEEAQRTARTLNPIPAISSPSAPPPATSSTDREIVALKAIVGALEGVSIGGSRRRVVEAALTLLGEEKP